MSLSVSVVAEATALEAITPAWQALLERSLTNEPALSPPWLLSWWRTFGDSGGRELRTLLCYRDGQLVGMAPLLRRVYWYWPGIPFRRLELLASGEKEVDEICSDYLAVLVDRDAVEPVLRALAQALAEERFGPFDEILLPGMDGSSGLPELLAAGLRSVGFTVRSHTTGAAPYIPLPPSWDTYLERLSSSHRYMVKRSIRDFEKWAGSDSVWKRARTPDELEEGKRVLQALHSERWQSKGRNGVFESTRFTAFHNALLPQLLDRGALELAWLTVRGEPVAALYNILWNSKVYFYQSGRKVDLPKGIRPGIVMHARAIQAAIGDGRREYDFLAGASQYKTQLALATRPLVELRAFRGSFRERARRVAAGSLDRLRALRDVWRPRRGRPGNGEPAPDGEPGEKPTMTTR